VKSASQSWEDEKFSYLIFSKDEIGKQDTSYEPVNNKKHWSRILDNPSKKGNIVQIFSCLNNGKSETLKVTKSLGKILYTSARKSRWGDGFEYSMYTDALESKKLNPKRAWKDIKLKRKEKRIAKNESDN